MENVQYDAIFVSRVNAFRSQIHFLCFSLYPRCLCFSTRFNQQQLQILMLNIISLLQLKAVFLNLVYFAESSTFKPTGSLSSTGDKMHKNYLSRENMDELTQQTVWIHFHFS